MSDILSHPAKPNPYQSPNVLPDDELHVSRKRLNPFGSILVIVGGLALLALSIYQVNVSGFDRFLAPHPYFGHLPFAFVIFYGFAGGLTALFHLLYLLTGWPKQNRAGVFAIGIAIALAILKVVA